MLSRNFSGSIKISKHLNNTSTHHEFFNVIVTIGNWVCLNKMLVYVVTSQQLLGKWACGLVCLSSTNNCWLYTCVFLPFHTTFHWAQLIQNSSIRLKILHWSNCVLNFWCIGSNVESVFALVFQTYIVIYLSVLYARTILRFIYYEKSKVENT